ncbi:ATP-binding cassette domain-containing protein [Microbacterium sp. SYP-A9085]|uniref:ABC transporter ATP-binding protein n=1 Tax=Microbacterium sp. SYP-A9085 TaxID=2664454 RepID=UPI00129A8BC9|nr:ABC transporter ATP-binding protein [Microbacterium sp. SYP-A9085]MRH28207.1 ATP-binding cassette domain-containing protein [Microbacterium sp. SYP-A9085]
MVDTPLLRVHDLAVRHDGEELFTPAGASFQVRRGEVVLLLGPSGSGKSTLALALNGLIPQAVPAEVQGSVSVMGLDAASTPVAQLSTRVGMVFQDPDAQLVTGTVLDEVAFGPENLRLPVAEVLGRTETALRRVGLWDRRAENPDALSGGGRQRLAIAAALALGSPVLVLDEPTANLDPQGVEEVYAALADIVASGDRAVVLVEHNLDQAVGFVDRVVVLDAAGRTIADGPAGDILRTRAAELQELGVWLPTSTLAALKLRRAGYPLDPLPLTPAELRAALEAAPAPAAPAPAAAERRGFGRAEDVAPAAALVSAASPRLGGAPLIAVRGLTLRRGRAEVLHDVSLDVRAGEFVAIVGANGAGKTSLLHAIAGIGRPPRGTVRIGGDDITRLRPAEIASRIGFVFQNPEHQFVAHTVRDELAYGLAHAPDADARVADILDRFGLAARADVHPFLLSGGQKRRLSVGTALIAGAPVLALDEPTFGQDRARADELLELLAALNADGTTVLVVTHDMQLVTEYAMRTIVLAEGRVVADAPTADVFADGDLVAAAGLRVPPLCDALRGLTRHPELEGIARLAELPAGPPSAAGAPA